MIPTQADYFVNYYIACSFIGLWPLSYTYDAEHSEDFLMQMSPKHANK